ncbi:hypothetical protein DFH08DRAFT_987532 [Mycena albidolilacea]|uniref:Uncharacterized protein n=1 Tax=Mycena albidolilacea TaxID=1033008 RepID=A0AAD7AAE1_9AGAR|nr:hypothetical protein DFH08DRAFT_987532 [Mycena albidolilacea]
MGYKVYHGRRANISISNPGLIATPSTNATTIEDLRQSIQTTLPGTAGVHCVGAEDLVVYYDVESKSASRVELGLNALEEDLSALANACDADVGTLRERTMDHTKFSPRLDVVSSGLLDVISKDILEGQNANKLLRAELSHLKVYGKNASVDPHKTTLHRESTAGSLVVIFPTPHAGGGLTTQHENMTLCFDPSAALSVAATAPAVSYIALYGRVSSTMAPINAGHRVALVYNLFLVDRNFNATASATEILLENKIHALLTDPTFLPVGGFLAVGLAHKYAMPRKNEFDPDGRYDSVTGVYITSNTPAKRWGAVLKSLKGEDVRMRAVFERIGLAPSVKLLYAESYETSDDCDLLLEDVVDLFGIHEGYHSWGEDKMERAIDAVKRQGIVLRRDRHRIDELEWMRSGRHGRQSVSMIQEPADEPADEPVKEVAVHWLTNLGEKNCIHSAYVGEDSMIEHMCGTAAPFIPVPAFGADIRAY